MLTCGANLGRCGGGFVFLGSEEVCIISVSFVVWES
jgi:hypothetical protein